LAITKTYVEGSVGILRGEDAVVAAYPLYVVSRSSFKTQRARKVQRFSPIRFRTTSRSWQLARCLKKSETKVWRLALTKEGYVGFQLAETPPAPPEELQNVDLVEICKCGGQDANDRET
jgi:hypothetical protein